MMNRLDLILKDKDDIYSIINRNVKFYQVVTMKANIPGEIKNNKYSELLILIFDNLIKKYKPVKSYLHLGESGNTYIYYFPLKERCLKRKMVKLEEFELGRFIDIDCYNTKESIKRKKPRKCYLCNNSAFYCIRNKTHTIEELNSYIEKTVDDYLIKNVNKALEYAFKRELYLYPKFGLVSVFSRGNHKDMNYKLMIKSMDAIIPYLIECFKVGIELDIDEIFDKIREIGKNAELKMLNTTNGINTYKGLIFSLSIITSSLGYHSFNLKIKLNDIIKEIGKSLINDFNHLSPDTFGLIAYKKYKIMGARGEAIDGYTKVFDILEDNNLKSNTDLYKALFYLIYRVDDTILLKRVGSITEYKKIKEKFKNFNSKLIIPLSVYSKKNNLSFGGSADLLSTTLFLKKISDLLGIKVY